MSSLAQQGVSNHRPAFRRVAFQLQRRLGWPGLAGAALLLGALLADQMLVLPLEEERQTQSDTREIAALSRPVRSEPATAVTRRADLPATLEGLFRIARRHGLAADEGRYVPVTRQDGAQVRIEWPLYGAYPALRAFLTDVLAEHPALSLVSLELHREDIETAELEARPQFLLNLEGP